MAAHLSYGRVNLNILREAARKELREFLDKCAGSKVTSTDMSNMAETTTVIHVRAGLLSVTRELSVVGTEIHSVVCHVLRVNIFKHFIFWPICM